MWTLTSALAALGLGAGRLRSGGVRFEVVLGPESSVRVAQPGIEQGSRWTRCLFGVFISSSM